MRKWILVLLLLSGMVVADRAALVVQFDDSTVIKKCVEFQSGATAFEVMRKSGLHLATKDYGALGVALCRIEGTGCDANNCFCKPEYWGFYYLVGGSWEYSSVGITGYRVNDGDAIGFRWGVYGDKPELHSFSEICTSSATQKGGSEPLKYFTILMNGNCSKKPFAINVKERDKKEIIWKPTNFFLTKDLSDIHVGYGVGIRVLLHKFYFGNDAGFEKIAALFTDKEGNASFVPGEPGRYRLEFEKDGFMGEDREIEISECNAEIVAVNNPIEEPEKRETEPNITRVGIIAPMTAVVNGTVIVGIVSETGKPLAHENIIVEFSGGRKELVTNESGEATFTAGIGGVYSYSSPNHTLSAYKITNVIELTKIALGSPAEQPVVQTEEVVPSVGMAVANPIANNLTALAGGIIVLVLLYALRMMRMPKQS